VGWIYLKYRRLNRRRGIMFCQWVDILIIISELLSELDVVYYAC
jgi:hypothetical protein